MKPRTTPTIPASCMLGTLAFVLAKAEERLARGEHRMDVITLALEDHPVPEGLKSTCRGVWYAMTGETIRETLGRHKYLTRVRRHIHTFYGSDHIDALEEALGWFG